MKNSKSGVAMMKVKASKVVWYEYYENRAKGFRFKGKPEIRLYNKYEVSKNVARELSDKVEAMILMSKKQWVWDKIEKKWFLFNLGFVTLTLSGKQKKDDNFIKKKLLNTFLSNLRITHKVSMYVWRAEAQKNGNIHFHIIINRFVHHRIIRDLWNSIQKKYGLLDDYFIKHGHYDANSTDVHSIKRIRNLGAYISKYMTKNDVASDDVVIVNNDSDFLSKSIYSIISHKRIILGRVWSCCYFLSELKGLVIDCYGPVWDESCILWEKFKCFDCDNFATVLFKNINEWKLYCPVLWEKFKDYLWSVWNKNFELL